MYTFKAFLNGQETEFPELTTQVESAGIKPANQNQREAKDRLKNWVNSIRDINPNLLKGRITYKLIKS